eukprot:TRINITY_DN20919_c0_g1_i2.p3 TRINITY_DN20919_c0_g1~~TRINITY_DN20919_c0_g1_i2.p3  ORF type:complete len:107 (+),score=26.04 TRINITY_DN20919_c0_g1_i2:115-435(+)
MVDQQFFFFSSRRRHTRCREVSWARRCVQETAYTLRRFPHSGQTGRLLRRGSILITKASTPSMNWTLMEPQTNDLNRSTLFSRVLISIAFPLNGFDSFGKNHLIRP